MNDPTLLAIKDLIVALGGFGGLAAVIIAFFERRKKKAEAQKFEADYAVQISAAAMKLVDPLKAEIERLSLRVNRLERLVNKYAQRITYLMVGIDQLIRQIISLKKTPCWTPGEWSPEDPEEGH